MGYAFNFKLPDNQFTYYEGECKDEENARTKLEKIAITHCRNKGDLGIGEILRFEDGKCEILSSYNYSFNNGKLIREVLN